MFVHSLTTGPFDLFKVMDCLSVLKDLVVLGPQNENCHMPGDSSGMADLPRKGTVGQTSSGHSGD